VIDRLSLPISALGEASREIALTAVSSALGYSGIILSQFLAGLAEGFQNLKRASLKNFAQAASIAFERAYKAIKQPYEGTVLTVCRDWLSEVKRLSAETENFVDCLQESLQKAQNSLASTPQLLDILKKNRVVDAGGKAFVLFLEGILTFIKKGNVREFIAEDRAGAAAETQRRIGPELPHCVECCVRKQNLNRLDLVAALDDLGQELIFYGSKDYAKIRINTPFPDKIFSVASEFGKISGQRILPNESDLPQEEKRPLAFVTDTTCDLSDEHIANNDVYFVPIKVQIEDRVFTDKKDIIQEEFYAKMASSSVLPKTSQPSLLDFKRTYKSLLSHYQSIISIHLSSALSGTFHTALQAAQAIAPQRITVLDSKNVSVGLGLILIEGFRAYKKKLSPRDLRARLEKSITGTDIFVGIPTLKYLIKGGRVTKAKGLVSKILNINPVIRVSEDGRLETIGKTIGHRKLEKKVLELALKRMGAVSEREWESEKYPLQDEKRHVSLAVVHSNAQGLAKRVADLLTRHTGQPVEMVMNASPVLGAHVGPGAVAVAILKLTPGLS